uniref:Protein-serine/threonine phosphatase n=1 Tax=Haemonchus contortus TaxID=6289 RepID=A0A7I4Y7W1_HAECO
EKQESPAFIIEKEPQQLRRPWLAGVTRLSLLRLKNAAKRRRETMEQTGELRSKRSPHRLVVSSVLKSDSDFVEVKREQAVPPLLEPVSSPAHRLSKLFVSLFSKTPLSEVSTRWSTTYKKMVELKKKLDENEKLPGRDVYDRKIYDIVVDDETSSEGSSEDPYIPPFLKHVVDIVKSFSGGSNVRVLSPRFAPLLPDKAAYHGVLSPALFPFYKDDSEQQILPVPEMLEDSGLNEKDRERILEMVMEVSGARETVENAMKVAAAAYIIGESFEQLRASFNHDQVMDLDRRGYTFMEVDQMKKLHRDQGLKEPELEKQVELYGRTPKFKRDQTLWLTVADLAGRNHRRRRQINSVSVLKPTVLSPYQFAPVYGFSVLGPVVLSPNIFSPLILNTSILGPWVMSPSIPLPFIVSPYLLSPYVISPLVMAPFILNPYVLSPNVINPYVLSPLILSPLVICPDVISPMTLGGAILSPGVLSPSVLSKSYVMASVLSPSVLS